MGHSSKRSRLQPGDVGLSAFDEPVVSARPGSRGSSRRSTSGSRECRTAWPHLIQYFDLTTAIFFRRNSNTFAGQRVRQRPHLVHLRWMIRGGTEFGVFCSCCAMQVWWHWLAPCRVMASGAVNDKSGKTIPESRSTSNCIRGSCPSRCRVVVMNGRRDWPIH